METRPTRRVAAVWPVVPSEWRLEQPMVVPGSAIATALALEGPPDADAGTCEAWRVRGPRRVGIGEGRSWSRQRMRVRRPRQVGCRNERTAVPGSAVAQALALKGPPDAGVRIGEAKGRQVVSARELRSMARGRAVPRSVAQGVSRRASRPRKKGCCAGASWLMAEG